MTGLGYTVPAVIPVLAVCALEFAVLHTVFRRPAHWLSMMIVLGFQVPARLADETQRPDRHL